MRPNKSLLGNFSSESSQIYLVRKLTAKMKLFYYFLLIIATSAKSPSDGELCQKPRLCERCGRVIIYQKGTHQSRRFCRKIVDMPCCANKVFSFACKFSITVFLAAGVLGLSQTILTFQLLQKLLFFLVKSYLSEKINYVL